MQNKLTPTIGFWKFIGTHMRYFFLLIFGVHNTEGCLGAPSDNFFEDARRMQEHAQRAAQLAKEEEEGKEIKQRRLASEEEQRKAREERERNGSYSNALHATGGAYLPNGRFVPYVLDILEARYGVEGNYERARALENLVSRCSGKHSCEFPVTNSFLGFDAATRTSVDPVRGKPKELRLGFACLDFEGKIVSGSKKFDLRVNEGGNFSLSCAHFRSDFSRYMQKD